eukprot:m.247205 g.247205  ORF g.247205 m.247205 type:complete len:132 (-) comp49127_c0_seq1:24-419(-)
MSGLFFRPFYCAFSSTTRKSAAPPAAMRRASTHDHSVHAAAPSSPQPTAVASPAPAVENNVAKQGQTRAARVRSSPMTLQGEKSMATNTTSTPARTPPSSSSSTSSRCGSPALTTADALSMHATPTPATGC